MLRNFLNMGSVLKASEQKSITGGITSICPRERLACNSQYSSPVHCIIDVLYCCIDGYFEKCY
ncbi:hypothetical protein [Tenacibaculum soleae]|uniref:hypothetical protein n=1 Tax=Tenacibaculum soleae TaxID=447689 RepID=UPI0026E3B883|nr:hypothetical protein [Tenacibaculum soleae]MDO6812162.1 hypothetical protein [Tenacibaculum soleae]